MRPRYEDLPADHPHRTAIDLVRRNNPGAEELAVRAGKTRGVLVTPRTPHMQALEAITDPVERLRFKRDNGVQLKYEQRARNLFDAIVRSGWPDEDPDAINAERLERVAEARRQRTIEQRARELAAEAAAKDAAKFRKQAEREVTS